MRRAITAGMIDIYVEYTGNAAFFFNVSADPAWKDLRKGYALGSRLDLEAHRIVWLTPANASNAWALAVRSDVARPNGLKRMSDFGRWVARGGKVVLAGGDTSATIRAAAERTNGTNTAMVYGTDGAVIASGLEVLTDDRHDQPIYAPVPIIREAVVRAHPEIATIVRPLMESFDSETLRALNARIQIDGEPPASVAEAYLKSRGLLPTAAGPATPPRAPVR